MNIKNIFISSSLLLAILVPSVAYAQVGFLERILVTIGLSTSKKNSTNDYGPPIPTHFQLKTSVKEASNSDSEKIQTQKNVVKRESNKKETRDKKKQKAVKNANPEQKRTTEVNLKRDHFESLSIQNSVPASFDPKLRSEALLHEGLLLASQAEYVKAISIIEKSKIYNPESEQIVKALLNLYLARGQFQKAHDLIFSRESLVLFNNDSWAVIRLFLLEQTSGSRASLNFFEEQLFNKSDFPEAKMYAFILHMKMGQYEQAYNLARQEYLISLGAYKKRWRIAIVLVDILSGIEERAYEFLKQENSNDQIDLTLIELLSKVKGSK